MNKKIFFLTIFLLLCLITVTNYVDNYCLFKHNAEITKKQAQEICAKNYCDLSVDIEGLDDNQIIYADIKYGNNFIKIIEYIIFVAFLGIILYYFYYKKGINKEDIDFSKLDYFIYSSLANFKIINLCLINFSSVLIVYIVIFLLFGYFSFFCLFFIFKLLFKNKSISVLFSIFIISIPVLNYNLIQYFEESNYLMLGKTATACLIFFILTNFFAYHKSINKFLKKFSIILFAVCFLYNTSIFIKNTYYSYIKKYNFSKNEIFDLDKNFNKNIYIIIMDMYGGCDTLNYIGYKNEEFINKLEKRNFLVFKNIDSNYSKTHLSVPSMLNFKYVHQLHFNLPEDAISNSTLFSSLRKAGYNIYFANYFFNMNNFKKEDYSYLCGSDFINLYDFIRVITLNTCFENHTRFFQYIIKKLNFKTMPDILGHAFKDSGKKIVYIHLPMPHFPYLYDENENEIESINNITKGEITELNTDSYIKYLKYGNKKTTEIVDLIFSQDKNPVIIITGDHGARLIYSETNDKKLYENVTLKNEIYLNSQFNTLLAYYNSDSDKQKYKDTKTVLTFFRKFANEIFNKNFEEENRRFYIYFGQDDVFYDTVRYTEVK